MEHRHFQRKPTDLKVKLTTNEGKTYQAKIHELSTIGMRVVISEKLPARVKLVNVVLPGADRSGEEPQYLQMFVAWREEYELGLCLANERTKIDLDWGREDHETYPASRKVAAL